jgi:hypothetical protein
MWPTIDLLLSHISELQDKRFPAFPQDTLNLNIKLVTTERDFSSQKGDISCYILLCSDNF